ncbi:MAG: right-handed parallel beta-helix repeat-containing protein [Candidatus Diapherotrites archaeon]|uniref:Right-handed parallel beta-helix repeat-containing protein n=1 Tax=Candidatus Iainarchaeum sp. TaxID=3101447 RepID=A0A938YP05_9ARCH|nr:right-handed parallel beta-helix repeat-containing protein [Candidatus Diapherotrites archaeon]
MAKKTTSGMLLLAALMLAIPGNYAATYYVDVDSIGGQCSDTNRGTITQPWCTSIKGFTSARPGDTVYFREGIYRSDKSIGIDSDTYFPKGAGENSRITYSGYPGETAVITCLHRVSNWKQYNENIYYIDLNLTEFTTTYPGRISHLSQDGVPLRLMTEESENGFVEQITGPGQWVKNTDLNKLYAWPKYGGNIDNYSMELCQFPRGGEDTIYIVSSRGKDPQTLQEYPEADYLTFQNLTIEGGRYPIVIETDHIELKNCVLRNSWNSAVKAASGPGPSDSENFDHNNPYPANDPSVYDPEHVLVENCEMYNFGGGGVSVGGGDYWIVRNNRIHDNVPEVNQHGLNGILFKNNSRGSIAEKNIFYNLDTNHIGVINLGGASYDGIYNEGEDIIVRNNILYNVKGLAAFTFEACENCSVYNNLAYNSSFSRALVLFRLSNYHEPTFKNRNSKVKNNIFYNNEVEGSDTGGADLQYYIALGSSENLESSNNIIDGSKKYYLGSGSFKSLSEIQAEGYETNSITEHPAFVNLSGGNYRLREGSPGIDQGICLAGKVEDDFEGYPRPSEGCDIGPYEFCQETNNGVEICDSLDNDCDGETDEGNICTECGNGEIDSGENCSTCPADVQCAQEEQCCSGTCTTPACNTDTECGTGQTCTNAGTCNAACTTPTQGCSTSADCQAGEECCSGQCCSTGQECCQGTCCTAGQQCCNGTCTTPACSSQTECNDSDQCTEDRCSNAGSCNAACTHTPITGCGQQPQTIVHYENEVEIGKTQTITVSRGQEQLQEFTALLEYPNKTKITLIAANAKITIPINQEGTYNATVRVGEFEQNITFQGKTTGNGQQPEPGETDQTPIIAGLAILIIIGAAIGLKKMQD